MRHLHALALIYIHQLGNLSDHLNQPSKAISE